MSLRLFYNEIQQALQFNTIQNKLEITNGQNVITHTFDASGNYDISHSDGTDLISFDTNKTLTNDCVLYNHVNTRIQPINRTLATHTTTLSNHESRIGVIENSTETTTSITDLQNRIGNLENYIIELQTYISALRECLFISDETGNSEFDYSNLL